MKSKFSPAILRLKKELEYRNYSPSTVQSYCIAMRAFESFHQRHLQDLSVNDLKSYLHYLVMDKKCSSSHINQQISAFKIFVCDVMKKEWTHFDIKRPRRAKKIPEILSLKEVQLIIDKTENLKHRVMIQTMYTSGLRSSELLNLKLNDIDSINGFIVVRQGKGKKDRKTILSKKNLEELRFYYKVYR